MKLTDSEIEDIATRPCAATGQRKKDLAIEVRDLRAETARLRNALGIGTPWPLRDVLERLADAAEHLLDDHGCDTHGHEGVRFACLAAGRIITALDADKEATP